MFISKYVREDPLDTSPIPLEFQISYDDYVDFIEGNENFYWNNKIESLKRYQAQYIKNGENLFSIEYINGNLSLFERVNSDETKLLFQDIADSFDACLFLSSTTKFPQKWLEKIKKRISMPIYQEKSFEDNNKWLTIKSSKEDVLRFFDLEKLGVFDWSTAIDKMYKEEGIFVFEFKGWTILAGKKIETLFGNAMGKGTKPVIEKLVDWGRQFPVLQLRLEYTGEYPAVSFHNIENAEVKSGYDQGGLDSYINADKLSLEEIIMILSAQPFTPDDLRYFPEMEGATALLTNYTQSVKEDSQQSIVDDFLNSL